MRPGVVVALALVAVTCSREPPTTPTPDPAPAGPTPSAPVGPPPPRVYADQVFVGAGDIGNCNLDGARLTGKLLDRIPGTVFTLGDNAYSEGSDQDFADCYDPHWGRQKYRTWPAPGNHDYESPGAAPYFAYFGERAGDAGYYHFMLGAWDIYSLNSNIASDEGSAQYAWLRSELALGTNTCSLAYWHHPVRSSAKHGDTPEMMPIWRLLSEHGADVVLSAHDHDYERFAPMNGSLQFDPSGMREFVAGTGGGSLYDLKSPRPLSEVRIKAWGVLKLTLQQAGYGWEFIPASSSGDSDSGQGDCH